MTTNGKRDRGGFTLIELMVVLGILALLAAAVLPNIVGKSDAAKQGKAKSDIAVMEGLLDHFYLDMGRYPTTEEGLNVLYKAPDGDAENWKGPYSKKKIVPDPWNHPYEYTCPGTHSPQPYEIWSFGRDGKEGGAGVDADIVTWDEDDHSK